MCTYDIGIIGAGPCGISCAIKAAQKGLRVVIVECGRDYIDRYCAADDGEICRNCQSCNVISGFGGCVHYGDSAKLSYFPSGKKLYAKLENEYERIRNAACEFWGVNAERDFISNELDVETYGFTVKKYPVCIMNSTDIKENIKKWKEELSSAGVVYLNAKMENFEQQNNNFVVFLENNTYFLCKKLVLAMGRQGIGWFRSNIRDKGIEFKPPVSSIGFRFEMPKEYLVELGKIHPDFKARAECNGTKYKTFCFCAGTNGGRLKFANYGDYILLDGHILTKSDKESEFSNFALMRQILPEKKQNIDYYQVLDDILIEYVKMNNGNPIFQSYYNFVNMIDKGSDNKLSTPWVKEGAVYKLLKEELSEYCTVVEEIFKYIAETKGIELELFLSKVNVVGLELEGLWDTIVTDENFMTNIEGLYVGGDCGGETQGILQATMMGIKIAESM